MGVEDGNGRKGRVRNRKDGMEQRRIERRERYLFRTSQFFKNIFPLYLFLFAIP